jgi:hypothetical protein
MSMPVPARLSHSVCLLSLAMGLVSGLAGCGGGGDAAAPAATRTVDAYVGTWLARQCSTTSSGSFRNLLVITKVSDSQMQHSFQTANYASTNCAGTATPTASGAVAYTYTLAGSKSVNGLTVDKASRPTDSGSFKTFFSTDGIVLREGDDDSPADADGYPTAFETAAYSIYDKQ